jgi:hypothetical protein
MKKATFACMLLLLCYVGAYILSRYETPTHYQPPTPDTQPAKDDPADLYGLRPRSDKCDDQKATEVVQMGRDWVTTTMDAINKIKVTGQGSIVRTLASRNLRCGIQMGKILAA